MKSLSLVKENLVGWVMGVFGIAFVVGMVSLIIYNNLVYGIPNS